MIRAVLFDLDDTLYREDDFACSGFGAVAQELESRGVGRAAALHGMLASIHVTEGREHVLDKLAARLNFPGDWVPGLVERYRAHVPTITLAPDAVRALARLRGRYRLGCVTNGWAAVQRRKIAALGLGTLLDAIVVADDHGRRHWKPSPLPFLHCCRLLGVSPAESVHVGDDPERDVRGARNAGIASVRVRREPADCPDDARPACEVLSLDELERVLDDLNRAGPAARRD
ncbi:MAG TPA: HAD family hydrolase [Methylomirabilota bacterium]|jgi:putative hydrolase of the HAD superfamily